ncbi:MmpS family transport accessory protein [Mycolicibacterium mucogenicum]|uniref:MmpS family transport accessory protein n=1 Tax=Mycolicibacterium mucogenicum TaxID=56689 RepID=UPI000769DA79|nr:MmpS family transport accessory protein [Mycolicibacterium mucogenicum]
MPTVLTRIWVPVVTAVAVALGAAAVTQLRGAFGEVFGPNDTAGSVNYLDQNAQPVQASFRSLPWTVEISTTAPATIASLVAQGDGDRLGCRITVDGEARQEHSSTGRDAQTSCLAKNA